jgi:NAD(P)-dependent dehydrogenase (short-subunit alcohol dehydrogenase family)
MSMTEPSPFPTNEFADKRVLVTGGTRGIGAAVVRRFRLAGARARRGRRPVHPGITVTKLHLTRARHRIPPGLCDAWFCGDSLPVRVGKSAARGVNSDLTGSPGWIRTCDLCPRSNIGCPSEVRDRARYGSLSI